MELFRTNPGSNTPRKTAVWVLTPTPPPKKKNKTKNIWVRWIRRAGYCWKSKSKRIRVSDVLLLILTHGCICVGWPARIYLYQLCADLVCSLEDLPGKMDDRDGWRERNPGKSVLATWLLMIMMMVNFLLVLVSLYYCFIVLCDVVSLFYAKATLEEELQWYYLTYKWILFCSQMYQNISSLILKPIKIKF